MNCIAIEKAILNLPKCEISDLQRAILNERTLDEAWIKSKKFCAFHIEDPDISRFTATAFVRYCKRMNIKEIYAADTVSIFRSMDGILMARKFSPSLDGVSQACFGLPRSFEIDHPDYAWLLQKAFSSSLFFSISEIANMLILRDASTCVTIAGNEDFIGCMVRNSKRRWYPGAPHDGRSFSVSNE